mmetsp:Transcript_85580/g.141698  ORF Transcript_85580/g.141698 Transcript_85580/m.141698 type:complete len:486 (+) Transcript_85580:89-1546(+)
MAPGTPQGEASLLLAAGSPVRSNGAVEMPAHWRAGRARFAVKWLMGSTGAGLFADGYDFFSIDLAVAIISQLYPEQMSPRERGLVVCAAFAGAAVGHIASGVGLTGMLGRRACTLVSALVNMVGACLSACCQPSQALRLAHQLAFCRFFVGLGIGAREWPPSAALTAEAFTLPSFQSELRGDALQFVAANSFCFFVGQLFAPVAGLILFYGDMTLDSTWRLALCSTVVPSAVGLVIRLLAHDMEAFRLLDEEAASASAQEEGRPQRSLGSSGRKWLLLLGACLALPINMSMAFSLGSCKFFLAKEVLGAAANPLQTLERQAGFSLFMSLFAAAGTLVVFLYAGRVRSFAQQFACFAGLCLAFILVSGLTWVPGSTGRRWPMLVLVFALSWLALGVGMASCSAGPLHFPMAARSAASGVAATLGQAGAAVASALLPLCANAFGMSKVFMAYAVLSAVGLLITLLFTPRDDPGTVEETDPNNLEDKK